VRQVPDAKRAGAWFAVVRAERLNQWRARTWRQSKRAKRRALAGQVKTRGARRAACVRCCPRCPLYLRDSPGLRAWGLSPVRRLRFAPSVACGAHQMRRKLSPVGCCQRCTHCRQGSVLLPERSDRCNQPSCAFGGPP
jgi:hypothetical protein